MKIKTYIIDSFTDTPFKGNPAGVCLLDEQIEASKMQSIANELNLAETAFLLQSKMVSTDFDIRYFSPTVEVPFCGHATLASSKLILTRLGLPKVNFTTHFKLKVDAVIEGQDVLMKFPLYHSIAFEPSAEILDAFHIHNPVAIRYAPEKKILLIELKNKEEILRVAPSFEKALAAPDDLHNVIVTAKSSDDQYDFYSRCFCPWLGINEDPVTGVAHTVLAKYWGDKLGKKNMLAYQASTRGGFMKLKIISPTELEVRSDAQIILEGIMDI